MIAWKIADQSFTFVWHTNSTLFSTTWILEFAALEWNRTNDSLFFYFKRLVQGSAVVPISTANEVFY